INSKQDEKIYAYMKEKIRLKVERIKRHRANTKDDKTMGDRRKEDIFFYMIQIHMYLKRLRIY
ncbi:unnamed protein product, partial [marine sediment metagenome]